MNSGGTEFSAAKKIQDVYFVVLYGKFYLNLSSGSENVGFLKAAMECVAEQDVLPLQSRLQARSSIEASFLSVLHITVHCADNQQLAFGSRRLL